MLMALDFSTIGIVVAMTVAAMALVVLEFCTPSFGLLALLAIGAYGGAVYFAWTVAPTFGVIWLVVGVVGAPFYVYKLAKILPNSKLGQILFLRSARKADGEGAPRADEYEALVGAYGIAETQLRPVGAVRIDGRRIDAQAESGIIQKGQSVKVVRAAMTYVFVRAESPPEAAEADAQAPADSTPDTEETKPDA